MSKIGHIYVALLDGGIIKTGKTKSPESRISSSGFGNRKVIDYWVSMEFVGYSEAEREMIDFLGSVGRLAFGREYFYGVDFSVAVERANACFLSRSSQSAEQQRVIESIEADTIACRAVGHFHDSDAKGQSWANHVSKFRAASLIISKMITNRGVCGGSVSDVSGGISLFELSLLICSYHCEDGPVEYFAAISNIVAGNVALDDDLFIAWFSRFENDLKEEINFFQNFGAK